MTILGVKLFKIRCFGEIQLIHYNERHFRSSADRRPLLAERKIAFQ